MAKLQVDTALIETLAELLQRTGLTEIELAEGDSRIRVARQPPPLLASVGAPAFAPQAAATAGSSAAAAEPRPAPRPTAIRARCTRRWSVRSI